MEIKTLNIFYGADCLPYKDSAREIHFPLVGNTFIGANNTTQIRFYVDRIGGVDSVTWCVFSKLPNGQIGNEVLNSNEAVYNEELGEYYIEFSLSEFYTALKGDVYLSLKGYQGGINIEQDSDTGIYTIYGTPTIQATGVVKIGINYAPQTMPGSHFNTSDLQQILGALSSKANIQNTIRVVATISGLDPTNYNAGQLFYDKSTQTFYKINNSAFEVYQLCIIDLNGDSSGTLSNTDYNKIMNNDNIVIRKDIGGGDEYYYLHKTLQDDSGIALEGHISVTGSGRYVRQIYIFVDYLTKVWTFSNRYLIQQDTTPTAGSNNPVTSNGIKNYVDDKDTHTITLTNASGTLTDEQYALVQKDNTIIVYNNRYYTKRYIGMGLFQYQSQNVYTTLGNNGIIEHTFYLNIYYTTIGTHNEKDYAFTDTANTFYTTTQTDSKIASAVASVKANEFQVVEELPEEGEEGIIYLIEISSGVYQQYIWEGEDYLNLGTTQIDLSGYVQKTQTIAGISLSGNISASALTDALIYASDSDIDALF